jgi:hypothetical protein
LSSQTTDTPGTTTSTSQPWIAPEQLFKLTRSRRALQISVSATFCSHKPAPPKSGTPQSAPYFRLLNKGGLSLFSRISGGDSENNTRPEPTPQIHHQQHPHTQKTPPPHRTCTVPKPPNHLTPKPIACSLDHTATKPRTSTAPDASCGSHRRRRHA